MSTPIDATAPASVPSENAFPDPLATSPAVVPTDPTNNYAAAPGPRCFACDGYHGSVNVGMLCLQLALRGSRNLVGKAEMALGMVNAAARNGAWIEGPERDALSRVQSIVDAYLEDTHVHELSTRKGA